ncbi:type IV pilus modification PilV family protein [Amphibacillus cookii]|uniref:type IV pilus modification PilV family protein n=1 Tax=Amphibacillus cookii TaxID=767787 RepID=UPI0019589030|nr:prepilin-type N-terminal cleavage/methylation domain-containing protein [Amphibacillus cookii]MBM7541796.1 prepilin-type N-terminal cleavage/methylation domain-containing protein [Amphibacillus cookii]
MIKHMFTRQDGLTLVEVLASIAILSMIVVTFLTFFINSARTTKVSEDMFDASYLAQEKIESIYFQSTTITYQQLIDDLRHQSDHYQTLENTEKMIQSYDGFRIAIYIEPTRNNAGVILENLYKLIVKVYSDNDQQQAQIETNLFFDEVGDNGD